MGGYGVCQAYRRMLREEPTSHGAGHLIFRIWGDDHIRSLLRCRHALIFRWWDHQGGRAFHNNLWPNLDLDLESGRFREHENLLPTREAPQQMAMDVARDMGRGCSAGRCVRGLALAAGWLQATHRRPEGTGSESPRLGAGPSTPLRAP